MIEVVAILRWTSTALLDVNVGGASSLMGAKEMLTRYIAQPKVAQIQWLRSS